jgi:hypothetical protein
MALQATTVHENLYLRTKFQISTSKFQIRSKTDCLEFRIFVIVICLLFVFWAL